MPYQIYLRPAYPNELYHHGIKGQKWGVRRFQNPDGTLTAAGKKRYNVGEAGNRQVHVSNVTRHYYNGWKQGLTARWHTDKDYEGLNKQEAKTLRNSERGRDYLASKEWRKQIQEYRKTPEYKAEVKKAVSRYGILGGEWAKVADVEAARQAVDKVKDMSIEDALNAYRKRVMMSTAAVGAWLAWASAIPAAALLAL